MLQGDHGKWYSLKAVYEKPEKGAGDSCPCSKHAVDRNMREAEARQCEVRDALGSGE